MLISPRHLIDRLRYPRSRADELAALRARFAAQPTGRQASADARGLATELRELRLELYGVLHHAQVCADCARGHPLPAGRWDGGHCCSGKTLELFSQDEVAALKLAGTDGATLRPPRSDHAGCVFRGPAGCSLDPADRPTICVRYICSELRDELRVGPDQRRFRQLSGALTRTFKRFVATRRAEP
ncbi:MAG: hypothetical protein JRI68_02480 [Deltaproteobacteria bacterium]|nr:hypothetical protein [Deltaproteobacteria bacterium]